jgi:hypothetical protein
MSFRRDKAKAVSWRKWLETSRDQLIACGVPQMVWEDMRNWGYFLDHGYFTLPGSATPIIDVDRMNRSDALQLCVFLEQDDSYPESSALNRLQFLLRRGRHGDVAEQNAAADRGNGN